MKYKLIFGRTENDYETAWAALREIIVEVPDSLFSNRGFGDFHLIGGYKVESEAE